MSSKQGKKQNDVMKLLSYAGNYRRLTWLGMGLSGTAMVLGMVPYFCIWLCMRDLIAVAPEWTRAADISRYGWLAFAAMVGGILIGLPAGVGVLQYLLTALASEYEMKLTLGPATYLLSILLTFGVSLIVGLMVARKNRSIDMVAALKTEE